EKIAAAFGKEGFVRGDDMPAVGDRAPHVRAGTMHAADDLHDEIAMRVEHLRGPRRQQPAVDARPRLRQVAHEDALDGQLDAVPLADAIALALHELHDAAADGAAAEKTDANSLRRADVSSALRGRDVRSPRQCVGAHASALLAGTRVAASACSRSSIRSRTSSRPTDSRINPSPMPTFRRTSGSTDACVIVAG